MNLTGPLGDIAHVIQLAIAPVFLLTAVATILNVLTGRLARSVDRRRSLAAALPRLEGDTAELARREVEFEVRRIGLIYRAITLAVLCALLVAELLLGVGAHGLREADELRRPLALDAEPDQQSGDLRLRRFASHDRGHRRRRFRGREVLVVTKLFDESWKHDYISRKLRRMRRPSFVSTDSGWNCTP